MITWGALFWWKRTNLIGAQKSLETAQRQATMSITGALRTTPSKPLQIMLNIPPLHLFVQGVALSTMVRLKATNLWCKGALVGHRSIVNLAQRELPLLNEKHDYDKPRYIFFRDFQIELPTRDDWLTRNLLGEGINDRGHTCIYTDGSRRMVPQIEQFRTGAGIYHDTDELEGDETDLAIPLGPNTTVFQSELYALFLAVQYWLKKKPKNRRFMFLLDSKSAILAIQRVSIRSQLVYNCVKALNKLGRNNEIIVCWVVSHSGIPGNECADENAYIGAGLPFEGPSPIPGLSITSSRTLIKEWLTQKQNILWQNEVQCRQARMFLKQVDKSQTKYLFSLCRKDMRHLVGILVGHNRLNSHLFNMKIVDSPMCECGLGIGDSEHFLTQCISHISLRQNIYGMYFCTLKEILEGGWRKVNQFIKETKIFEDDL